MTQDEINHVLVEKAKEGKTVCRLKGGDPFVFGRGGEEAEALFAEHIPFEVVPGISSSIAAPAYAGIPLTHRKYSSSFAVIPGYEDTTKPGSSIDWSKLATGVGTLVFLMAVKNFDTVAQKLMENGRSPDTPVAVVRWGTRADQVTITGTLGTIAGIIKERDIKPPAVTVIGDVVRLREHLSWFEKKPMFGHRVLVTRETLEGFGLLEDLGAEVIGFPTIEISPLDDYSQLDRCLGEIASYHWIILTSTNGVTHFFNRISGLDMDIRELKGIKICAIGEKTAKAVSRYGIRVDLVPDEFRAEGLLKAFTDLYGNEGIKNLRVLLPRAEKARELFPEKFRELGGHIDVPPLYRAARPEAHGKRIQRFLREGKITIATFASAATFNNFCSIIGEGALEFLKDVAIAVIGPVTRKAIEEKGLTVAIMPEKATVDAMVDRIIAWAESNPGK
jgi:uroporphyrinogen III methyltransferase/synthase